MAFILAVLIILFTIQPAENRKSQRIAQSDQTQPGSVAGNQQSAHDNKATEETKLVIFTERLVVVGAVQGVVLLLQAGLYLLQIRTSRAIERAWITAKPDPKIRITGNTAQPATLRYRVSAVIKNFGKTPALILESRQYATAINVGASLPPEPRYPNAGQRNQPAYYLFPGAEGAEALPLLAFEMGQSDMDRVNSGQALLYVYGFVKYKDAFKKARETRYCFRYYPADLARGFSGYWVAEGPPAYHRAT